MISIPPAVIGHEKHPSKDFRRYANSPCKNEVTALTLSEQK